MSGTACQTELRWRAPVQRYHLGVHHSSPSQPERLHRTFRVDSDDFFQSFFLYSLALGENHVVVRLDKPGGGSEAVARQATPDLNAGCSKYTFYPRMHFFLVACAGSGFADEACRRCALIATRKPRTGHRFHGDMGSDDVDVPRCRAGIRRVAHPASSVGSNPAAPRLVRMPLYAAASRRAAPGTCVRAGRRGRLPRQADFFLFLRAQVLLAALQGQRQGISATPRRHCTHPPQPAPGPSQSPCACAAACS
jgi:hypothetical protein